MVEGRLPEKDAKKNKTKQNKKTNKEINAQQRQEK